MAWEKGQGKIVSLRNTFVSTFRYAKEKGGGAKEGCEEKNNNHSADYNNKTINDNNSMGKKGGEKDTLVSQISY